MLTFDATVGGVSANSLLEVDAAVALLSGQLFATFPTEASLKQKQALVTATQHVTRLRYRGVKAAPSQALAFPRQLLPIPDMQLSIDALRHEGKYDYLTSDMYYPTNAIPDRVQLATALLADGLVSLSTDPFRLDTTATNIKREKFGQMETEYVGASERPMGWALFPEVLALLSPLFLSAQTVVRRG